MVKHDNRNHEPITEFWRGDRSANTDDRVEIQGAGLRTDRFHQPLKIAWVAGVKDVGLQALNRQDPAQLTGEVTIFGFGQNITCDLLVGLSGGLRPAGGLVEFFFDRKPRKASHDSADGVDIRDRGGRRAGGAGGTGGKPRGCWLDGIALRGWHGGVVVCVSRLFDGVLFHEFLEMWFQGLSAARGEGEPAIQSGGAPFASRARLNSERIGHSLDRVAQTDLLVADKAWKMDFVRATGRLRGISFLLQWDLLLWWVVSRD